MTATSGVRGSISGTVLALAIGAVLLAPVLAAAQEPVPTFNLLNTRLKVGDTVWVTNARGNEIKGKIRELNADSLELGGSNEGIYRQSDVRAIFDRPHDSLKPGTLRGLGIGLGIGLGLGVGIVALAGGGSDAAAAVLFLGGMGAGIGAGIGVLVDAAAPMPKRLVYRAPGSEPNAHSWLAPIITPRAKGVSLSFAF